MYDDMMNMIQMKKYKMLENILGTLKIILTAEIALLFKFSFLTCISMFCMLQPTVSVSTQ